MKLIFWSALLLVAFTYAGYPVLMALLAAMRPRLVHREAAAAGLPRIDLLLVVYNGAALLPAKLDNLKALDYPRALLRLHVVCDGCEDATEALARSYAEANGDVDVRVVAFAERRGKSACIGAVLPQLDAELVMFVDVRQRVDSRAAAALAAAFSDLDVGAASGELVLETEGGYGQGVDAYWRYEKMIRRCESLSGSLVGVTGALYAARREALTDVPGGIVLDDMWIPLSIAARGYRIVFVPGALAYDRTSGTPAEEERRKRRTLAGNYQLLHRWPRLALPGAHPLALRLWGHKWLRLLAPWLLLLILLANVHLARGGGLFYPALLLLQLGAYGTAIAGRLSPALARLLPVRLAAAFVGLNLSAMRALFDYFRNPDGHLWRTTAPGAVRQ